jgi:asparagine synthase (glutamine-hydrolysing)
VKPLFVHRAGERMTVASEASILSDLFGLGYSSEALDEYSVFRGPIFTDSYFQDVRCVTPGTCEVTGTFFEPLTALGHPYRENQTIAEIKSKITSSICSRLVADAPVGLLFSGGIDSNILRALAPVKLSCFTGGMSGDYDVEFARRRAPELGIEDLTIIEVGEREFRERFHAMVELRKEPLSVPNEVILSFLAEAWAKRGGKVLISGEGADEFFAGYDRIFSWAAQIEAFDLDGFIDRYCYIERHLVPDYIKNKIRTFFDEVEHLSPFEAVRYFFVKKHLPVLFRRLDFALMYSGVEGREPLASTALFEFAMSFGPATLLVEGLGKMPLRELAAEEISPDLAFAKKVGFPVDLGRIFGKSPSSSRHENYEIWRNANLKALEC